MFLGLLRTEMWILQDFAILPKRSLTTTVCQLLKFLPSFAIVKFLLELLWFFFNLRQPGIEQWKKILQLYRLIEIRKAWFPYDRTDRPSRKFEAIRTTGTIGSFHMIVLIASKARDAGSSAMSLGEIIEYLCVFRKQAKHNDVFLFGKRTSWIAICFLSRFCGVQ